MTTYNTGNPIGSTDARDRLDNTENMDYLENSTTELTHPDRLGTVRKTRHGMEVEHDAQIAAHESEHDAQIAAHELEHDAQIAAHESEHDAQMQSFENDFDGRLAGMAFTRVGSFTTGATLTDMRQVLVWEVSQGGDGHEYGWAGTFPKVVAAGATTATSGGIGAGAWVDRTDVVLRDQLAESTGATKVGTSDGRTVEQRLAALPNELETALAASAYIKDASRHAVERASGGRQTVLYDDLGNPSIMNIIPIFRYEDLGYNADMGTGVATCFDVGTGSRVSEIFIGAFQSSLVGSRAVSLPRTDQATSVNFDTAKTYCANKGAGWHLMTMHEWAAISLWCMANGFEPRGNTNYGRAHDRYVERGRRMDNGLPGDTAGMAPRVDCGSGPDAWRHNNSPWGISDLVGNVGEWLDGFKLQDGQIIASTFNTQAEESWVAQAAYFDATLATGGAPKLSNAVVNRLGAIGNNQNSGYSATEAFNVMTKADTYVSNQLLKRLLVEPATVLPKGRVYMRNFGERLPSRGGSWDGGSHAGLAALNCRISRAYSFNDIGFRLAFA